MNYHPLPTEFAELAGKVEYVQKVSNNEYKSSCPFCGDAGHVNRNGPPDRFVMIIKSNAYGGPLGWCRRCGRKWWPDMDDSKIVDPETIRKLQYQAAERQRLQDEDRRQRLAEFTTQEIWLEYCERMEAQHRRWWESQGVPEVAQTYLSLGYNPEKIYKYNGEQYTSPAYTIPWFGADFDFLTMQYRLTNPVMPGDKYRFEYGLDGGASHIYRADPADAVGDKVIVCEGAKKAIVTRHRLLPVNTDFVVVGVVSKGAWKPVIDAVKDCGLVFVVFDPDGLTNAKQLAKEIGKAAHVVSLPYKVDDGFVSYGLTDRHFQGILDTVL